MKRFRIILLAGGLLLGLLPLTAAQAVGGPKCADIDGGGALYRTIDGTPTVRAGQMLLADPCKAFTYSLVVLDEEGTTELARTDEYSMAGDEQQFSVTLPGGPEWVCVYAEVTTAGGQHTFDRAPDDGCEPLELDSGDAGGSGVWK